MRHYRKHEDESGAYLHQMTGCFNLCGYLNIPKKQDPSNVKNKHR